MLKWNKLYLFKILKKLNIVSIQKRLTYKISKIKIPNISKVAYNSCMTIIIYKEPHLKKAFFRY